MYGLVKGYVSRKPTGEDNEISEEEEEEGSRTEELQDHSRTLQIQKSSEGSSYGRFISWGIDGVSYLGSQFRSKVAFTWWSNQDSEDDNAIKMATTKRSGPKQPEGTVVYSVKGSDTLNKIALLFDITPSELTRMNKLTSRMLYPGQVLFVPDKSKAISDPCTQEKHTEDKPKPQTPHGNHEKIKLTKKVSLMSDDEEEISETFLKIKGKHITDGQGVVGGVVLITPHSVIFNPNVSDPLVMDRGRDKYCIKTPMSAITSAALYRDIAAMAIHDPLKSGRFYLDESTRESVSRQNSVDVESSKTGSPNKPHSASSQEMSNIEQNNINNGLQEPQPSIIDREGKGNSITEHEELVLIANELLTDLISDVVGHVCEEQKPTYLKCSDNTSLLENNSISLSPLSEDSGICSPQNKCKGTNSSGDQSTVTNKEPLSGCDNNEGSSAHTNKGLSQHCDPDTSHDSIMESTEKRHSSFFENLSGDVKYWLGVSYRNEDDHAFEEEIVPKPATTYEDNLVYLCIRISKQHWCMCLAAGEGYQGQKDSEDVMNRDKRRREHWFAIPASRIEHVYGFINKHCTNIKRTLSVSEEDDDDVDDEEEDEAIHYVDGFYSCTPPKPKINMTIESKHDSLSLELDRPSSSCYTKESVITPDLYNDLMFMPEMSTESQILSTALIKKLNKKLPSRAVGHGWTLVYSTFNHGFSLKTLYRNMEEFDSPMLIVVQDDEHQVFGVVTSCPLKISDGFYGTGQSFLFKFDGEDIKTYLWQGDNDFFIKGSVDCVAFGGGGGHFGLWLDEDFYHGSSHYSETYHNEALSKQEDFLCSALEAWTFM